MSAVLSDSQFDRNQGLGASDAAASVGQSKWRTPLQLYREKIGELSGDELFASRLPLRMGLALESLVLELFAEKTGLTADSAHQLQVSDHAHPWRWVTLDAMAGDGRPIEAKTTAQAGAGDWGDEHDDDAVPMTYYLQCQHSMACGEWDYVWLPMLVLNRQFRVYRVVRDNDVIAMLTQGEATFMEHVNSRTPPDPIDIDDVASLYPTDDQSILVADADLHTTLTKLRLAKDAKKAAQQAEDDLVLQAKRAIGTHAIIKDIHGSVLGTWKQNRSSLKFQKDKFRVQHPALYQQFEESVAGVRPLLVK